MSESRAHCTHPIWEPCLLHPVDCPNCMWSVSCSMRPYFEAHKDRLKRCRFFERPDI